jgi:hypothetical protein
MFATFATARLQRIVLGLGLSALCLTTLIGCVPRERWVSQESSQGQVLAEIAKENRTIKVAVAPNWPLQFEGIRIDKRFTEEAGTQYRAMLPFSLAQGQSMEEALLKFARQEQTVPENSRVVLIRLRLQYYDAKGNDLNSEIITVDASSKTALELPALGKSGSPHFVEIKFDSAVLVVDSQKPDTVPMQ